MHVDHQVRVPHAREASLAPDLQLVIQLLDQSADLARRDQHAAELLDDLLHFPCRDALDVHLHQGEHPRLLAALISLEEARLEASLAVLRDPQIDGADSGVQSPPLVPVPPAATRVAPLEAAGAGKGAEPLLERCLEHLLHHCPHQVRRRSLTPEQRRSFVSGHLCLLRVLAGAKPKVGVAHPPGSSLSRKRCGGLRTFGNGCRRCAGPPRLN